MPTYRFHDSETDQEWEEFMGIQEAEDYLKKNPNVTRLVNGAPRIGDPNRVGTRTKPDEGFREVLRNIKRMNPGSNMNTF